MEKDYFKYYRPSVLITLIVTIFILVYLAKNYVGLSISLLSSITFLIMIITEYLWKYRPFKWFFWVDDFSGRYEGRLVYEYRDDEGKIRKGELQHVKIISQNGKKITVYSFTKKLNGDKTSLSTSKGIYVEKTKDNKHFIMVYNYLNNGNEELGHTPHYGTEVIKFIKKGNDKIISGSYYTSRLPYQTRGTFKNLKWVSDNLDHEF